MMLIKKALQFATAAHEGQYRKDGTIPYIEHPKAVVGLLEEIGITEPAILASGYLHDVVEDCDVSIERLFQEFNPEVARIVAALTRNVSREEYKERIKSADYPVQIIKLADTVHNCSELYRGLPERAIRRKIEDCESLYFGLAKEIYEPFYHRLKNSLAPFLTQ